MCCYPALRSCISQGFLLTLQWFLRVTLSGSPHYDLHRLEVVPHRLEVGYLAVPLGGGSPAMSQKPLDEDYANLMKGLT